MTTYQWPADTMAAKLAFYGDPRHNNDLWQQQCLSLVPVPWKFYFEGKPCRGIRIHNKCVGALKEALNDIWEGCGRSQAAIESIGMDHYGGSYEYRPIRGSSAISNHSFGAAIDFDPGPNGFNAPDKDHDGHSGTMKQLVVQAFKKVGARWGGDYRGRKDPMHFEFVS